MLDWMQHMFFHMICVAHDGMLTVTLDGLASSDPDGDIIADWVWKDIDSGDTVCDDIDELCEIERGEGNPSYSLTITDIYGDSDTDTITVTIIEPNAAPTVFVGQDQEIDEGEIFILDATASLDPDGCDELTYTWDCEGYEILNANDSYISITSNLEANNSGGEYTCEVCVNDGYDYDNSVDGTSTSCASIDITVNNINVAPVADGGPGLVEYQIPHDGDPEASYTINLDCSLSSDDDMDDLSYTWSDVSGTICSSSSCDQDLDPGTYEFTCSVDDGYGGLDSDNIYVVINDEINNPPIADIDGDNLQIVDELVDLSLDGCGSYDNDSYTETGEMDTEYLSYDWSLATIYSPEEEEDLNFSEVGFSCDNSFEAPELITNTYVIVNYDLVVTDTYGLDDTQNATRVITNVNQAALTAGRDGNNEIVIDPDHDCDSESFYADISLSEMYTDPDLDDLLFNWFKGEELICEEFKSFNENGMGTSCTIEFDAPGVYEITLAVEDIFPAGEYYDDPITVIENYTITVNSEIDSNNSPSADAGQDKEFILEHDCVIDNGIGVDLDASASSDGDGDLLTYKWILEGEVLCDSNSPGVHH